MKQNIQFVVRGRLGNAIFRYLACSIMCIFYDGNYVINNNDGNSVECSEDLFIQIKDKLLKNELLDIPYNCNIRMNCFYQHCSIYTTFKKEIQTFIINNPKHYILTDGINAGDKQYEKFFMDEILNTPIHFNKRYKNVLHLRLEDFVTYNLYIPKERIIKLLEQEIITNTKQLCIVCKNPTTNFEY